MKMNETCHGLALWVNLTTDSLKCRKKDHCKNLEDGSFVFGPVESDVASVFASLFSILGVGWVVKILYSRCYRSLSLCHWNLSSQKTPSPQVEPGCGGVSAELQEDAQTRHHSLHCVAKVSRNCWEVVYMYIVPLNQFRYLWYQIFLSAF